MNGFALHLVETIGVEEAARVLGVHPYTLYRWAREGRVPCVRLGRSVRFRVAALQEWMQQQEERALRNGA